MLEFDAASKHFGAVAALDACSFTARPGRLTGFLGPNGDPDELLAIVEPVPVTNMSSAKLRAGAPTTRPPPSS